MMGGTPLIIIYFAARVRMKRSRRVAAASGHETKKTVTLEQQVIVAGNSAGHTTSTKSPFHSPLAREKTCGSNSIGGRSREAHDIRNKQHTGSRVHENTRFLRPVWRLLCARHRPSKKNFRTLIRQKKRFHTRSNFWFACVRSKPYAIASTGFFGTVRSSRPWAPGWIR